MSYVAPLTYGVLVAHFIPGFILYVSSWALFWGQLHAKFHLFDEQYWIPFILLSVVVCFTLGLLVDGFRAYFFDEFLRWQSNDPESYRRPTGLFALLRQEEALRAIDYLIEKYYRFYQLYANTCVSLFFVAVACLVASADFWLNGLDPTGVLIALLGVSALTFTMFRAARGALGHSIKSLREFRDSYTKEGKYE